MASVSSPGIPLAPGLPLVGNLRPMLTAVGKFFTTQYLQLGPVFRVPILNQSPAGACRSRGQRVDEAAWPPAVFLQKGDADIRQVLGGDNPTLIELDGPDHRTMRAGLKEGYSGRTLDPQMEKLVRSQLAMVRPGRAALPSPPFRT